ncbi:nucleoside triphosphate pyrophosphohydrolase [Kangiella sp. TOML190]|uniref:nucleoside triphosphate pyrophosphohydrolase n=1 Tax=Kangiella sp. TOML190 TaxID=2931351 RepID=UPI00203EA781|nr:nucleoside triphosphate pyrophosphohydrolase [Kangiella sp. TOML190]
MAVNENLPETARLLAIMRALRDPETGCPWDKKQTYASIAPYTLEEAYEVADAIEQGDFEELHGELGDLLFQVIFYAQIGQEEGRFDFESIAKAMADKLERRHPHVFADQQYISDAELKRNWEQQKQQERQSKNNANQSLLDDLPKGFPSLSIAQKIQKRVGRHGFDWPSLDGVINKIEEEMAELKQAVANQDKVNIEEEIGDLLFAVVNLSRHLDFDAETALRKANRKFETRFRQLETIIQTQGLSVDTANLEQLEQAWQQAKAITSSLSI